MTLGQFETFAEKTESPGVTGQSILDGLYDADANNAVILALQEELDADGDAMASQVDGAIDETIHRLTDPASASAQELGANGTYAIALMKRFAADVKTFDKVAAECENQYQIDLASARRWAQDADLPGNDIDSWIRTNTYNPAWDVMQTQIDEVGTAFDGSPDPDIARQLIRDGFIPLGAASLFGLTLTNEDKTQFHTSVMADMTPEERRDYILDHEEISPAVLDGILENDDETRELLGAWVADKTKALDEDSSEEDVSEVNALLERFEQSEQASAGILEELGGAGLIQAFAYSGVRSFDTREVDGKFQKLLRDIFRAGEPALAEHDPEASRDLAKDMVGEIRRLTDPDEYPDDLAPGQLPNSVYGLSYMLKNSTLSTEFLDTMGDELDDYERNFMGERGMTWRQMTTAALGGAAPFGEDGYESAFDPMASYMSALGKNDEAALEFFTAGGDNEHSTTEGERQDYWIQRRNWGHDDFNGLMSALDAATTGENTVSDTDARALMSNAVEYLVNRQEGETSDGEELNFDDDNDFGPGDLGGPGAEKLAHMFGTYMAAVDYYNNNGSVADGTSDVATIPRGPLGALEDMPVFNQDDLDKILKVGLSNDEGFAAMRIAVSNYENLHMAEVAQHHGEPGFNDFFNEQAQSDANLEALFMKNIGELEIADGLERDEQIKNWIDMGSDLTGLIPVDKVPGVGQTVGFLADQGRDAAVEELKENLAHYEEDARNTANDNAAIAVDGRKTSLVGNLYDAGAITRTDIDQQAQDMGLSPSQVDEWFEDGFPSREEIDGNQNLKNLITEVGGDIIDYNAYQTTYKTAFHDYFEK